ncbi:MAG: hypothetical protein L0Y71_17855 [Gemmataceae bacterium]|nr:hypothetical protein [Gemmataceae bacterium]
MTSPEPDISAALQAVLGYLNFAEGRPDPRFQKAVNDLYTHVAEHGSDRPWEEMDRALAARLEELHAGGASAFREVHQAQAVLRSTAERVVPAYRRHHTDLLAHLSDADEWQPFFLARVYEAVLRQRGPWDEHDRIVAGTLKQLNDFVGHRPIATLESRPEGEPYDRERVRPVPLYLRGAGVAWGRYQPLIAKAIDILETTEPDVLREAHFDPTLLDELALDPRAYDFDHPADKRPNYVFGEWDPHHLDGQARYRRFIVRSVILEALWQRVDNPGDLPRDEALAEAAVVLAGTMLMAAGVSGAGPDTHDSSVTLSTLTPRIAKYRDAFYRQWLRRLSGPHAERLAQETRRTKQPFGAARQALNQHLASERALQLQHRRLALFFADLGAAAAGRRQLAQLPVASARVATELHIALTTGRGHVDNGESDAAAACLKHAEDLLHRGIACGALVDPWNILGFQGQYPRFQALEDSVRDHRIGVLTGIVAGIFDLYAQVLSAGVAQDMAAGLLKNMNRLAEWWDRFATTTVSDIPHVHGGDAAASAEHVSRALTRWRQRGAAAGDLAFWRRHVDEFRTPKAFGTVINALLHSRDFRGASGLLITWLSQAGEIPLEAGEHSFQRLAMRWLLELSSAESAPNGPVPSESPANQPAPSEPAANESAANEASEIAKFFAYVEANAEDWWSVPALEGLAAHVASPQPAEDADAEADAAADDADSLYGAAYENMSYRDSTDDGVEAEILDFMPQKDFSLEHVADELQPRLHFLATLARLWILAAPPLRRASEAGDRAAAGALAEFHQRAQANQAALVKLLDGIHAHIVPKPSSGFEAVVEFDRRVHIKEQLLGAVLQACRDHALAVSAFRSAGAGGASALLGPPWESALLALETHLRHGDRAAARTVLAEFVRHFRSEPLSYTPLSHGGEPRVLLRTGLAHAVLAALAVALPRQGLLRDTWRLLRLARAMEAGQGGSVTEFHRPFQAGLQGVVEAVLDAALREQIPEDEAAAGLEQVVEPFLPMWIDHFQTTRLSMLETVRSDDDWRRLAGFCQRYGRDLFTRRFLTPANMQGVLHRGVGAFLNDLRDGADPLHPIRLVDELDRTMPRDQAERWLRFILESLLENQEILRDYNQTCTQADFGDHLPLLFDFLRLKARYERAAWNFRPLHFVHDILVRRHPPSAAEWREQVGLLTRDLAEQLLEELGKLEQHHGMRLATIRQRLDERFVGPLEIDRLAALVEPALQGAGADEPSALEQEVTPLANVPGGVGLDVPGWLQRLEQELIRVRQAKDPLARLAESRLQIAKGEQPFADLIQEFEGWEQES